MTASLSSPAVRRHSNDHCAPSGIPWGLSGSDPAPTALSAGTRPAEIERTPTAGAAAPGVPPAALLSQRAAPLPKDPNGARNSTTAYRCDHCGTVRYWSLRPGPQGGPGFCDCGADPLAWFPVCPKAPELAPSPRLASVAYRLKDGSQGSIVGACPVSELLEDLRRVYGDRLAALEPRGPDFNDGLAAPRHG